MPEDSLVEKTTEVPLEESQIPAYSATLNGKQAYVGVEGSGKYTVSSPQERSYYPGDDEWPVIPYVPAPEPASKYPGDVWDEKAVGLIDSEEYPSGKPEVGLDDEPAEPEGIYHALLLIKYDKEKDNLVVGGFFPADMEYRDVHGMASIVYGGVSEVLGVEKDPVWELVKPLEIGGQNYTFYALTDSEEALKGATEVPLLGEGEMPKLPSE